MSAAMVDKLGKPLFTVSTEAYILIQVENNYSKWLNMCKYYQNQNDFKAKVPKRKEKDADGNTPPDPLHDAKYTTPDAGQSRYGTFSEAGLDKFEQLLKEINDERKKNGDAYRQLEKDFLVKYRAELQIVGKNAREEGNRKRRRNPGNAGEAATKRRRNLGGYDE